MDVRCPQCGKEFVRRIPPAGLLETVAGALTLRPFVCQLCGHRFRAFQRGGRAQPLDQRQYERIRVSFPMTFSCEGQQGEGAVLDLSINGCGVKTSSAPAAGTILTVYLQAPDLGRPIAVEAAVSRSVRSVYVGVEFLRLHDEEQYRLTQFLAGIITARRQMQDFAAGREAR
jgi:hypothetical protein